MTIEDLYEKIMREPELTTLSPLFKVYCLVYEAWVSQPGEEQHLASLCDIIDDLKTQQPEKLHILLDGTDEKNLTVPTSLGEPEWLIFKKAMQEQQEREAYEHAMFVKTHKLPSLGEQASGLINSMYDFAASGFKTVTEEQYNERRAICEGCQFFDPNGFMGIGRCRKCGCSSYKLNIAASRCPFGYWESLEDPPK